MWTLHVTRHSGPDQSSHRSTPHAKWEEYYVTTGSFIKFYHKILSFIIDPVNWQRQTRHADKRKHAAADMGCASLIISSAIHAFMAPSCIQS